MLTNRLIATFLAIALSAASVWAQILTIPERTPSAPERTPFAPAPAVGTATPAPVPSAAAATPALAAERFWDIGYELAHMPNITGPEADQGIILLTAAKSLDAQMAGVEPLLLNLARHSQRDYSEPMLFWLQKYVGPSADRAVVAEAVRSMLSRARTPDERKALLEKVALKIKNKNAGVDSDLAVALGLVMLEKGSPEQAKFYLVQAYNNNKFNRQAFDKLVELAPNEIGPAANLEHLRMLVRENPLDLDTALRFAAYAQRLELYEVAALSYQYCGDLFHYLYPSEPLPANIYLPWAVCCCNTTQGLPTCQLIAQVVRETGRFDLFLEALAGKAALRAGKADEAQKIFQEAEQKAQDLIASGAGQPQTTPAAGAKPARSPNARQLAWFYCFADMNPDKALDWANKAYSAEPNSPAGGTLLAYALCLNKRVEVAKPLFATGEQSQTADLVRARLQLAAGNKPDAIQTLKNAVARNAGSLEAEVGKQFLRELGSAYIPPVDPRPVVSFMLERLGKACVPQFTPPDQMVDLKFTPRTGTLSYGGEIEGTVTLVNKGPEPLVLTENSLIQGNIRVAARVTGSLQKDIPNLVSETLRTDLALTTGRSLVCNLRLSTGELRELLLTYPQANLEIAFTLYLDPVVTETGVLCNRLVDIKPVTFTVTRPALQITADSLQNWLKTAAAGPDTQRIQTALLFTGLLKEQQVMVEKGTLYKYTYVSSQPGLLRQSLAGPTGLLLGGADGDAGVKVNAIADLLSLPLDQELANVVARRLSDPDWSVRLMAVYVLAKGATGSFDAVLDWVIQNDKHELVRSMATSLRSSSTGRGY